MTEYQKNLIEEVNALAAKDNRIGELVDAYKAEVDSQGDRDGFAATKLFEYLNNTSLKPEKFLDKCVVEHRYLQGEFLKLVFRALERYASLKEGQYDGRNEYWVLKARKAVALLKENDIIY